MPTKTTSTDLKSVMEMFGEEPSQINPQYLEAKRRQAFRSNVPELREFEQKINNAYIRKNQACQIKEKEYRKMRETVDKRREKECILEKVMEDLKIDQKETERQNELKQIYGKTLLYQQKIMEQQRRAILNEEKILVKIEHDALIEDIQNDNIRKIEEKKVNIDATRFEMQTFMKAKEVSTEKQRLLLLEEYKKIEEIKREQEEIALRLLKESRAKIEMRESIKEQIAANMLAQQLAQQEREQLIQELLEHEYLNTQHSNKDDLIRQQHLDNMKMILDKQIESNIVREKVLKEQEAVYRKQLLATMESQKQEDNKQIERLKDSKKKYALDIKTQIHEDLEKRKNEKLNIQATYDYVRQYNEDIQRKIHEEKDLLLKEHIGNLPNNIYL